MNARRFVFVGTVAGGVLSVLPLFVYAISGKDQIASEGRSVTAETVREYGWPDGTLELVNDGLRGDGWCHWFSECPNDVRRYEMKVRNPKDVQHLVDLLVRIKASKVQVLLDPGWSAAGTEFSIGSQKVINKWYERLPEVEPGVRTFGVHRFRQPPEALAPTLTLSTAHVAVDLRKLEIPRAVTLDAAFGDAYRKEHRTDRQVLQIDEFLANRKEALLREDRAASKR